MEGTSAQFRLDYISYGPGTQMFSMGASMLAGNELPEKYDCVLEDQNKTPSKALEILKNQKLFSQKDRENIKFRLFEPGKMGRDISYDDLCNHIQGLSQRVTAASGWGSYCIIS